MTDRYPNVDPAELETYEKHSLEFLKAYGLMSLREKSMAEFAATQLALRDREIARLARALESSESEAKFTAEERDELENRVVHFREVCAKLKSERDELTAKVLEMTEQVALLEPLPSAGGGR